MTGLNPATSYLYRVKAYYVNGTESLWSNYREVVLKEGTQAGSGDLDGNGEVNVSDVTLLINAVLTGDMTGIDAAAADVTGDGEVNVADITMLITMMASR